MSLQVEKLEKNMAKLTIEAPADEFEKAAAAYSRSGKLPTIDRVVDQSYVNLG